jgi:hypothetical protein
MVLAANTPLSIIRGEESEYPASAAVIYDGSPLGDNGSGYARGIVAGDPFIGHSMEFVDNSGGSAGDLNVTRICGRYRLEVTISGVAITDVGKDVYCSANDAYTLTSGSNSRVGVVVRYVTTNTAIVEFQTTGSISSRLNLILSSAASGEENINAMTLTFTGTGGPKRGLYLKGEITGAGNCNYGMFKFRTYINGATNSTCHTLCANLHIKDAGTLSGSGEYAHSAIYATVETEITTNAPVLSGGSLAAIYAGYYVTETGGAPLNAHVISINTDPTKGRFDGLFKTQNAGDLGDSALSGTTSVAFAGGAVKIPIKIGSTTYYLVACVTPTGS